MKKKDQLQLEITMEVETWINLWHLLNISNHNTNLFIEYILEEKHGFTNNTSAEHISDVKDHHAWNAIDNVLRAALNCSSQSLYNYNFDEPIFFPLNDEHTAEITNDFIKVGCAHFDPTKIIELADKIKSLHK